MILKNLSFHIAPLCTLFLIVQWPNSLNAFREIVLMLVDPEMFAFTTKENPDFNLNAKRPEIGKGFPLCRKVPLGRNLYHQGLSLIVNSDYVDGAKKVLSRVYESTPPTEHRFRPDNLHSVTVCLKKLSNHPLRKIAFPGCTCML